MRYYPVNLNITDKACLVVGGGGVGTRKVSRLLECGAQVTVISPEASFRLHQMASAGHLTLHLKQYESDDIKPFFLIIGATNQETLNRQISRDASAANKLCNIVDRPDLCNFILPAVVSQGDLVISISTSGQSPAFAKHLRCCLEQQFGPEYATFLQLMGAVRHRLLQTGHAPEAHKTLFETLIQRDLLTLIRRHDVAALDHLLRTELGDDYTLQHLLPEYSVQACG